MNRQLFISLICFFLLYTISDAQEKVTTVLIVRHAEKSATPAEDPILSAQGTARAELLARMFEKTGVTGIYTSQYARTRLTAEPLARKISVPVKTVDAASSKKLADTIRANHSGGKVLVVAHSNTIPEIIEALGGGKMQELPETEYDNLFLLTLNGNKTATLVQLKFFPAGAEQVCQ